MRTELAQKASPEWLPDDMTEDSLAMNVLDPMVIRFIGRFKSTRTHGSDYQLPSQKQGE